MQVTRSKPQPSIPPPSGRPLVSREVVDAVKRKLAAPSSNPPTGASEFIKNIKNKYHETKEADSSEIVIHDSEDIEGNHHDFSVSNRTEYKEIEEKSTISLSPNSKIRKKPKEELVDETADDFHRACWSAAESSRIPSESLEWNQQKGKQGMIIADDKKMSLSSLSSSMKSEEDNELKLSSRNMQAVLNDNHPVEKKENKVVSFNFKTILNASYRELKSFVTSPCEPGYVMRCYIERNRSGGNMFAPVYSLCADLEDGTGRELMVCRKVMKSRTPHYVFSLNAEDLYKSRMDRRMFLGKLRGNGTEYIMYDNGAIANKDADSKADYYIDVDEDEDNDSKASEKENHNSIGKDIHNNTNYSNIFRKELVVIHYNIKKRPSPLSVRGCEVCIPCVLPTEVTISNLSLTKADSKDCNKGSGLQKGSYSYYSEGQTAMGSAFQKIMKAGKQNDLMAKKFYITHERTSK